QWRRLLAAYDYHRQLERGYTVTRDEDGRVVRSVAGIRAGARLAIQAADGAVRARVEDVSVTRRHGGGDGEHDDEHGGTQR
ncbi:MAG: hypothetical protein M0007_02255, partial [Actinomycetota bacterium]|nr:hypothetical protein [Actinomycetota bacterium]